MTLTPANPLLSGRVLVVTGASRGIGRALALALAEAGAHIVAVARNKLALEDLDDHIWAKTGMRATLVPMDLANPQTIDLLGAALYERFGKLDGLIAAAGDLGRLSPLGHIKPQEFERVLAVNLTANWRILRAFDPLLRKGDHGRVVFITSAVAIKPRAFWGGYAISKAGLENLAAIYADEIDHTDIRITLLDPGRVRTQMRALAFPGEDPESLPLPEVLGPLVIDLMRPDLIPDFRVRFQADKGYVARAGAMDMKDITTDGE